MDRVSKFLLVLSLALLLSVTVTGSLMLVYREEFSRANQWISENRLKLQRQQALLDQKDTIEAAWSGYQELSADSQALNHWVRDLIAFGGKQGIKFEKLEPRTTKKRGENEELHLYLMFQGDARKFTRFLYGLHETDPVVRIQGFSVQQPEEAKGFRYELTLTKVLF